MSQEKPIDNPALRNFNPKFRRRRKFQGADWTPGTISADTHDGVWCPQHRMRHGYKSNRLGVQYEKTKVGFRILWICKETGAVIGQKDIGNGTGDSQRGDGPLEQGAEEEPRGPDEEGLRGT